MSSFFTLPASQRKRKRADGTRGPALKKRVSAAEEDGARGRKRAERDESISGSDSDDEDAAPGSEELSVEESESEEGETAAERRLKLAERYLDNVREEIDEVGFDAADVDRDLIAERLKEDADESKGRRFRLIASTLSTSTATHTLFRADTQSTTSIDVYYPYIYTASKDNTLIKWKLPVQLPLTSSNAPLPRRLKPKVISFLHGRKKTTHTGPILTMAISPCGSYLATGGADKRVTVFSTASMKQLKSFSQHRDSVTGLSFSPQPPSSMLNPTQNQQLFSASSDRTLKTFSLPPGNIRNPASSMAYVETLFGHQDPIPSVAAMAPEFCVSVGSRDRTARYWNVVEENQLLFRGGGTATRDSLYQEGSIDVVAALPPHHFVTGSDAGTLSLWSIHKKKPLHSVAIAHGVDDAANVSSDNTPQLAHPTPRWITALAILKGTDVVVSGSWDGVVRMWKISDDKRKIERVGAVGIPEEFEQRIVMTNGTSPHNGDDQMDTDHSPPKATSKQQNAKGIINSLAVFERFAAESPSFTPKQPDSKSSSNSKTKPAAPATLSLRKPKSIGITIVAAVGKEHRLARWKKCGGEGIKNGAVVLDVGYKDKAQADGEGDENAVGGAEAKLFAV